MPELKTKRPYQERFLDGFDRSRLRQEVEAVQPRKQRFAGIRKKYAGWALGASLALGGIGAPLKMIHGSGDNSPEKSTTRAAAASAPLNRDIENDLTTAKSIADQVAGGVQAAVGGVQQATESPLQQVADAPKQLATFTTDQVKQQFFKSEVPFGSIIYSEAKKNNLRPELVAAVVHTESKFQPTARSGAGAQGLMQLVPKTGRWMGARNLMNPAENIMAGTKYLKYLHDRFNGDEQKVIAAYNAGEGNVRRFNGVPPFRETRNYVNKVKNFEQELKDRFNSRQGDDGTATLALADATAQ